MKINFSSDTQNIFYETEIGRALDWLYLIRDTEKKGWAWVQFIAPNEQNTAEVIYAFAENEDWLKSHQSAIPHLIESIKIWLLDTSHCRITIDYCWVCRALQKLRECSILYELLDKEAVQRAIEECLGWLCANAYRDPKRGIGWGDNSSESFNVIRTALAIMDLNEEIRYGRQNGYAEQKQLEAYEAIVEKAEKWLASVQNSDGGWGNLDPGLITQDYQRKYRFSFEDLRYQCDSNAASTGYTMLALASSKSHSFESELRKAFRYLNQSQMENGGWSVFTEVGVRDGERYTFRHFGTAWALQGIINSGQGDYREECVIHGFEYLSDLQDSNYGGWRSSPDADNYTWATCNALSTIKILKKDLAEVHANHFLNVVWDWWTLKKKDATYSFQIGKRVFAFNSTMALTFCITFSVMITLLLVCTFNILDPFATAWSDSLRKLIYSVITVLDALILGLPWIVYVKNRFKQEVPGWIDSIGWVYGIITGFVLVLYQFIL